MSEPFDYGSKRPDGQYERHPEIPQEERRDLKRPVRRSYKHLKCGGVTTMPQGIAETYAKNPTFYGSTFCATCGDYFRVGDQGLFVWVGENGEETADKVGV